MRKVFLAVLCCLSFGAQAQQVFNNPNGTQILHGLILGDVGFPTPLVLNGGTSGQISIGGAPVSGTYTLVLPNTAGTSGNALATGGNGGNMSWIDTTNASSLASGTVPAGQLGASGYVRCKLLSADFNSTADQSISCPIPTGATHYRATAVLMSNPSISMTTAICGVWTAASKGGVPILGTGTGGGAAGVSMAGLTTNVVNTSGSLLSNNPNNLSTAMYAATTLFFVCTTAQGSAATADVTLTFQLLN